MSFRSYENSLERIQKAGYARRKANHNHYYACIYQPHWLFGNLFNGNTGAHHFHSGAARYYANIADQMERATDKDGQAFKELVQYLENLERCDDLGTDHKITTLCDNFHVPMLIPER